MRTPRTPMPPVIEKEQKMAADKVYVKIRLKKNASPHEDIMQVLDCVLHTVKAFDDASLYNHKITFGGELAVKIEFTRKP